MQSCNGSYDVVISRKERDRFSQKGYKSLILNAILRTVKLKFTWRAENNSPIQIWNAQRWFSREKQGGSCKLF